MKLIYTLKTSLLCLMFTTVTFASDEVLFDPQKGWTATALDIVNKGNSARGKQLSKKCKKCHGKKGVSDEDDTPSLAGQVATYTFKQLHDYKSGKRSEKSMKKATKKLSYADMADLAAYFEKQEAEPMAGGKPPALVNNEDKSRLLLSCSHCHNENKKFRENFDIPATLQGQKPEYFVDTLMAFKEGDRENDLYNRMQFIANILSEEEIEQLAAYYSAKPVEDDE